MLNNTTLTTITLEIIALSTGLNTIDEIEETFNMTDTRENLEDFRKGCYKMLGDWQAYKNNRYFIGQIQFKKGQQKRVFLFIPQDEWNIILLS